MAATYTLDSAVESNRRAPATFQIDPQSERESLRPGDLVKLMFRISDHDDEWVERMWVIVEDVRPEYYVGVLDNYSLFSEDIISGLKVQFHSDHVTDIDRKKSTARPPVIRLPDTRKPRL